MNSLHSSEIGSTRKVFGYILSMLPSLLIVFSGMAKIMGLQQIIDSLAIIGLNESAAIIGTIELIAVLLYWIPKTMNIGFFLLCSYMGGVIVAEWQMGSPVLGICVAIMIYVGTMLRKPNLSGLGI